MLTKALDRLRRASFAAAPATTGHAAGTSARKGSAFAMDWVDVSLHLSMSQVAAELAGVFDAWEMCCWLAAPNSSLDGRAPLDVLDNDPGAVLQAARMDRFIARG